MEETSPKLASLVDEADARAVAAGPDGESRRRHEALESFYGPLADSADAARRVGWESAMAQRMRLYALISAFDPASVGSILDAGCGECELVGVLDESGFEGRYRGEDLREAAIERASRRLETHRRRDSLELVVADAFADGPKAEVVFCSGALNTESGRPHQAEVEGVITTLFSRAETMLVLDLAVADRHRPGVGIAAVDIVELHRFARQLAPICTIREDVVVGEAMLVMARSRAPAFRKRSPDAVLVAENLVLAGEPKAALALLPDGFAAAAGAGGAVYAGTARGHLIRGRALALLGEHSAAMAALTAAAEAGASAADSRVRTSARLAMAPLLWRAGKKREAEELLVTLSGHDDEAKAHLFELYLARGQTSLAGDLARRIGDSWMRRELIRILDATATSGR